MNKQKKYLAALTRRAKDNDKVKTKIKEIKIREKKFNWLAQ